MTVRVAFLGDSHAACIMLAARSMDLGRCLPTFFVHPRRRLNDLRVEGDCLVAGSEDLGRVLHETSGGFEMIDPERFDLYVVMGLEFEFPFGCLGQQFYSRSVTEQTIRDRSSESLAFSTVAKLRRITKRPVWLLHAPLFDLTHHNRRPGVLTYARFLDIAGEVFQPLGASILPQPEETRSDDHFSKPEFSRSPVRLKHRDGSLLHVKPDNLHKNELFGKAIVSDLVARLEDFQTDDGPGFCGPDVVDSYPSTWRPRRLGTLHRRDGNQLLLRMGKSIVELNPTAAVVWDCCDGTRTEEEILAGLGELFDVPEGSLRRDLREAIKGLIDAGVLEPQQKVDANPPPKIGNPLRLRLGLVSETTVGFLNQVKLCLFSLRNNGGALSNVPVTLITNSEPLHDREAEFLKEHFSPIEFKTSPKLGAIPHTSKLNVFYSIDPSTYDVLMFMDCDTVVRQPLDHIADPILNGGAQFVCRRGGETDRNRFVDFDAMVSRFCGQGRTNKIIYEGMREWPMFNSGVFLATSEAVRKIRRCSVEFTYRIFNEWQINNTLERLPEGIKKQIQFKQDVLASWPIEQGALALACINSGVKVQYLEESYNSWGGETDFHILHCFKSLYKFNRRLMFSDDSEKWIEEYLKSDVPGKAFLASMMREYLQHVHKDASR